MSADRVWLLFGMSLSLPIVVVAALVGLGRVESRTVQTTGYLALLSYMLLVAVVVLAVRVDGRKLVRHDWVRQWAEAHALILTPTNRPFVVHYLRTGRQLRWICVIAGIVVPPLARSALDPSGSSSYSLSLVGILVGYLVGTLWAELALTRPATTTGRAALLEARRLEDYLPTTLRRALRIVGPLSAGLWALALFSSTSSEPGKFVTEVSARDAVTWALAALAVPVVVEAAQRWILRRPQPLVTPDLLAADDAVRSQSLHVLGGTGVAIVLTWTAGPLLILVANSTGPLAWLFGLSATAALLGALVFWRYWCHRAWRVQRRLSPSVKVAMSS